MLTAREHGGRRVTVAPRDDRHRGARRTPPPMRRPDDRSGRGTRISCSAPCRCSRSCRSGKSSVGLRMGQSAVHQFAEPDRPHRFRDVRRRQHSRPTSGSRLEFVVGYGLAVVIGVPLGILMGWYIRVNAVLDPFVSALYATPRIALMPLIIIWFGIGMSEDRNHLSRRRVPDPDQHDHRRAHDERRLRQGRALVRLLRPADVPDRGAAVIGAAHAHRIAAGSRTRAGRHRGRRDVRRHHGSGT